MDYNDPTDAYQYVLQSHPRGQQETIPITNSCNRPWKTVTIDMFNNCMLCVCEGWLPVPVGKITDFSRLEDIWDNPIAKQIQQDVADKKFTNCAVEHCGIKHQNVYESRYQIIFAIDDSCNLQCPSCRREKRLYTSGPIYESKLKAFNHCIDLLNKFELPVHILFSCSGDPLASHISRPILHSYQGKDTQTFTLFTNGLLIKKQLPKTVLLDRITEFRISIDAGSAEVYKKVRVGGDWDALMENFEFLVQHRTRHSKKFAVNLQFVIQKNNYKDIPNFVNLCKKYSFKGNLSQLDDWGTWNKEPAVNPDVWTIHNGIFPDHDVLNSRHPEHQQCRDIVLQHMHEPMIILNPRLRQLLNLS